MKMFSVFCKFGQVFAAMIKFILGKFPKIEHYLFNKQFIGRVLEAVYLVALPPSKRFAHINFNRLTKYLKTGVGSVPDYYKSLFRSKDLLANLINADLHHYLPDDILTKVDRASLANSLESRPPFLDHELIELACSIDSSLKVRGSQTKYILKKAVEGLLPRVILYRKKKGFALPLEYYFRKELRDLIVRKVQLFNEHHYFDHIDTKRLVQDHLDNKTNNTSHIWSILMFNLWWERWIKNG